MDSFRKLFEPVKIGKMEVPNRIVMPPTCTRLATPDGAVTKRMIDYYVERAKGGVGLMVVEYSYIDEEASRAAFCQLGVYNDHLIAGLNELAEAVKTYGVKVALQICHAGRQTTPERMGRQPVAPSPIPCKLLGVMPRELTEEEVGKVGDSFAEAAGRTKAAGFDAVEIHGAHGYLICEFLSPYTNKRTDRYGGDLERRARFAVEVVEKIRKKVGSDFPVGFRVSGDEYVEGGLNIDIVKLYARMLEDAGVDYLHVSGGMYESMPSNIQPIYYPHNYFLHLAEEVKKVAKTPVITVGSINVEDAGKIVDEGKADLVAFGRALIADPDLPRKLREGIPEEVCPCIRCHDGCISRFFEGKTMRCAVNAAAGREEEYRLKPAEKVKKVAVVGGGVAGMEAARVAAVRGHNVTLYEAGKRLGGHLVAATVPDFKADLRKFNIWLQDQLRGVGVKVRLKAEVKPSMLRKAKPDVVIIAVGSKPLTPDIPGIKRSNVTNAVDVLLGRKRLGREVAVVGGGLVGCETALHLSKDGRPVTIVEMLEEVATDVDSISRDALLEKLSETGVRVLKGMRLEEVTDEGGVFVDKAGKKQTVKADSLVLALGLAPNRETVKALQGLAPEVYAVGDCVEPRKISNAIHEAYRVALSI